MDFKVGDLVKGLSNNEYTLTNENMICGEVVDVRNKKKSTLEVEEMLVAIREHIRANNIGKEFWVLNSKEYFKLVEKVEKINNRLVGKLLRNRTYEIEGYEREINEEEENIKYHREKVAHHIKRKKDLIKELEANKIKEKISNKEITDVVTELKMIAEDEKVEDLKITDERYIEISTVRLFIEDDEHPKGKFHMNKYRIQINMNNYEVKIFGIEDEYNRESCWASKCPHPHISNSGKPCWGNTEGMIVDTLSNNNIYTTFMICINYLETFNYEDSAGKNIKNWDFRDKETGKLLENPYGYGECDCGCEGWDEDDIEECNDCGRSLCPDCRVFCEDCEEYYCEEHTIWSNRYSRYICDSCLSEYYTYVNGEEEWYEKEDSELHYCNRCGEPHIDATSYEVDGEYYCCEDCVEAEGYERCYECEEWFKIEDLKEYDGERYCECCYEEVYEEEETEEDEEETMACDECGTEIANDDLIEYMDNQMKIKYLCEDCMSAKQGV